MSDFSAAAAGTFKIGGHLEINRLGFGAMRLTGPDIWGQPLDRDECMRTLRRLPELDVNFIDTADCYGPGVSEELIRECLHPSQHMLVATKGGLMHPAANQWELNGDPAYLRRQAEGSAKRLGLERIDLWQLHRIDPAVSREAQFEAIARMIDQGVIRFAGLSAVSVADIEEASRYFPVATVQNRYNVAERRFEDVLEYCEMHAIGFIAYFPLGNGTLARIGSIVDPIAAVHGATPAQVALALVLAAQPGGASHTRHVQSHPSPAECRCGIAGPER